MKKAKDQTVSELLCSVEELQNRLTALETKKKPSYLTRRITKGDIVQIKSNFPVAFTRNTGFVVGAIAIVTSRSIRKNSLVNIALPKSQDMGGMATNNCKAKQLKVLWAVEDLVK